MGGGGGGENSGVSAYVQWPFVSERTLATLLDEAAAAASPPLPSRASMQTATPPPAEVGDHALPDRHYHPVGLRVAGEMSSH